MSKMRIATVFYTLSVRFLFLLISVLSIIPIIILVFLIPQRYRYNRIYFWASYALYKLTLWAALVPIEYEGKEHVPEKPALFVANHSSSLDIALLGSLVKTHPHVWLAMQWLTNFLMFRLLLPRVAILVDMSSPQKGVRSLIKTINVLKEHDMHAMIFPEGRRYTDGKIHDFYGGFALLAKRTAFPVVPVRIFDAEKVYPPDTFWMHYRPIKVVVGKPMYMGQEETDTAFKDRVHRWFLQQDE